MYRRDERPIRAHSTDGPLAVAVPGEGAGYLGLHVRWGKLPRAKVLEPAIRLAHEGVVIDERYRGYARHRLPVLRADPEAARIFLHDGEVPPLGWKLKQPELARTLEILAESGPAPFYEGEIATAIAADLARRGGILTEADLSAYRVRERKPLVGTYLGHAVATAPLPSSGGMIVLSVLNALQSQPPQTPWPDPAARHLYIEAAKRAVADRRLLADPAFVDGPVDRLVAKERARNWVEEIGFLATPPEAIAP